MIPLCYLVFRRRKRNFLLQKEKDYTPPYSWQPEINTKFSVFSSLLWNKTTTLLRKREDGEKDILDIAATLQTTIASGGFVDFQYKASRRPVEYLFLIDRATAKDHAAIFYQRLADSLAKEDIYACLQYAAKVSGKEIHYQPLNNHA